MPASRQWRGCCASALHFKKAMFAAAHSVPKIWALAYSSALVAIFIAERSRRRREAAAAASGCAARLWLLEALGRSGAMREQQTATTQHTMCSGALTTTENSKSYAKSRAQLAACKTLARDAREA